MTQRYWLIHRNGACQLINASEFDLEEVRRRAVGVGASLISEAEVRPLAIGGVEPVARIPRPPVPVCSDSVAIGPVGFQPPHAAIAPLFRSRLTLIHECRMGYALDINARPTSRVLGTYYKERRLVRIYTHDRKEGRRPLEELFDTFLHEVSHHLEYTEPEGFAGKRCGRVHGRMHSPLFWRILGELKYRWRSHHQRSRPEWTTNLEDSAYGLVSTPVAER